MRRSRGYAPLPVALPVPVRPGARRRRRPEEHVLRRRRAATPGCRRTSATWTTSPRCRRSSAATEHLRRDHRRRAARSLVADRHPGYRSAALGASAHAAGRAACAPVQHHHAHIAVGDGRERPRRRDAASSASPSTAPATATTARCGAARCCSPTTTATSGVAHLRYVPLPGGDAGVRDPCRMALSHLHAAGRRVGRRGCRASPPARRRARACWPTSSRPGSAACRRPAWAGCSTRCPRSPGSATRRPTRPQAAMRFEGSPRRARSPRRRTRARTALPLRSSRPATAPRRARPRRLVLAAAAADVRAGVAAERRRRRGSTAAVAELRRATARRRRARATGLDTVALSGGVFLQRAADRRCARSGLRGTASTVLRHRLVPPNDGGLALGQARRRSRRRPGCTNRPRPNEE